MKFFAMHFNKKVKNPSFKSNFLPNIFFLKINRLFKNMSEIEGFEML